MIDAPVMPVSAESFIRRAIIDRITGAVHVYWPIVSSVLIEHSQCSVMLAEGVCWGKYVLHVNSSDVPGAIIEVTAHRGTTPDMLTRAFAEALLVAYASEHK